MSHSFRYSLRAAGALTVGILLLLGATAPEVLHVGHFSMAEADSNGHPADWRPLSLSKVDTETQYQLTTHAFGGDSVSVVKATSDGGASGLVHEMRINPAQHPILSWHWQVSNVLEKGNAREKDGDDYPARIYVSFDYDPSNLGFFDRVKYKALKTLGYDQIPTRALNYIWASSVDKGTVLENPYTDWVRMVVVESGSEKVGQWVMERRNIREDYRQAFGEEPPAITGIAIMTDTDNTGESATAYYGDITVRAKSADSAGTVADDRTSE